MDPERWRKIEDLFHQALDLPAPERDAWLAKSCAGDDGLLAEVASLLASQAPEAHGFVQASVERAVADLKKEESSAPPNNLVGRQIGPYRLTQELGQGGMGVVYLASRADAQYESEVAIKLVRPGLDTDFILRRFRRERQILARLHHPNIAHLFDGGTTEDQVPYFVMEYVDGPKITQYAAKHELTVEDRLRLFLPVCSAVDYAHRAFIVHRDLKPANILIDRSGTPKLLDFGISKLLRAPQLNGADPGSVAETQGIGLMTPEYASPEQIAGGPVTIASDVYSLGAVLYELLTNQRAHRVVERTPQALERAICVDPLVLPSAAVRRNSKLARRMFGDLDSIVLQAMRKEPERRYPSAGQLAEDLRRHLEHRPVTARPNTLGYRAGKFIRRNPLALAGAATVAILLIGAAGATGYQASASRDRLGQVARLSTTFLQDVEQIVAEVPGAENARRVIARIELDYLDRLSQSAGRNAAIERDLAAAYGRLGRMLGEEDLGDTAGSLRAYTKMAAIEKGLAAGDAAALRDYGAAEFGLAMALPPAQLREKQAALELAAQALQTSNDPPSRILKAAAEIQLGDLSGDRAAAARYYQSAFAGAHAVLAADPRNARAQRSLVEASRKLAEDLARAGDRGRALATLEAPLELARAIDSAAPPGDVTSRSNLARAWQSAASVYELLGDEATARQWYRQSLAEWRRLAAQKDFSPALRRELDALERGALR